MKWITREKPKIDRIACPWLIKKFIDKDAIFYYVASDKVLLEAERIEATPFDVPNVELTHKGEKCTFDALIKKYKITDPAIKIISDIVRGADTDNHTIASQCSGLWAISAGLSYNFKNDHNLLKQGMVIYDALYSWAKYLRHERHTQNPTEALLIEVYEKLSIQKKKSPRWVKELKELLQDQIDTNMSLSLKDISKDLSIHPAYLSRQFAKHFDNLSFGDYLRKIRIEKAIALIESSDHSLSQIAYITGFSDQSHFNRIFKKHTGKRPMEYKMKFKKGKKNTKS